MNKKESFVIEGLAGKKKLKGTIRVGGAKNAALKAMAASILFDGPVKLENVPDTDDVGTMTDILIKLGAKVAKKSSAPLDMCGEDVVKNGKSVSGDISIDCKEESSTDVLFIDASMMKSTDIDPELARSMRASIVLTGPILARFGKVSFPAPGGCVIGARPIDLFLKGYEKMGATITLEEDLYHIEAKDGLKGTEIYFDKQSVTGTETLMMAASLSKGKTVLKNCAMEPEIVSEAEWLDICGANIRGAGTSTMEIQGTKGILLHADDDKPYQTIPDRIEAGSFLILGALCADEIRVTHCRPDHLDAIINALRDSGVIIDVDCKCDPKVKTNVVPTVAKTDKAKSSASAGLVKTGCDCGDLRCCTLKVSGNPRESLAFKACNIKTHEYPGFPTDLQSPIVAFLTQADGESVVFETIYEGRFKFVEELAKMGADITVMNPREILIKGPTPFSRLPDAEELTAHDLRAGFAVVMAALTGKGRFIVNNVHLIDRGYERLEERLRAVGAEIERVQN